MAGDLHAICSDRARVEGESHVIRGKDVGPGFSSRCFFCRRYGCQGLSLECRRSFLQNFYEFCFFRLSCKDDAMPETARKQLVLQDPPKVLCVFRCFVIIQA